MIIDPNKLDFDELASYRDMKPSALPLADWKSTYASGKSSLKKAKAVYNKHRDEYEDDYMNPLKELKREKTIRDFRARIDKITDTGIMSQSAATAWKKYGDKLRIRFDLPKTTWRVNKHPVKNPEFIRKLKELSQKMKRRLDERRGVFLDVEDYKLLAQVAGMPAEMTEVLQKKQDSAMEHLSVFEVGYKHLQEDVKRIGIALAAREVMDRQAVTEEHAAKARADLAKKRRAAEKRAAKKAKEAIKVQSKTLAKRGRSKSPGPATKRSRTLSPPKGTKRRSQSRDRGGEKKERTMVSQDYHRYKTTGKDKGAQRLSQVRNQPAAARRKPSVASREGPYVRVEKEADL